VTPITAMAEAVPETAPPANAGLRPEKLTTHGPPLDPPVKLLPCHSWPAPPSEVV
jgi:hypothetical protein